MTPGRRGWLVLALLSSAVACFCFGAAFGNHQEAKRWENWTYSQVAFETKASKLERRNEQ